MSHTQMWVKEDELEESCHADDWVMSHIELSHGTHINESPPTYEWVMSYTQRWVEDDEVGGSCHADDWGMLHI